ncbi:MAG: magnesium transporter [Myxococcales bacterium]|nr:magnesium transporter [Myxococcales bacterium]
MRLVRLIGPELEALLRESPGEVRDLLDEIHPEDLADIVAELEAKDAGEVLKALPTEYAAEVFERLDEDDQEALSHTMGADSTARIAAEMGADERVDFFSIMPPGVAETVLESLERVDPEAAEEVEELRRWPESSAGGLMTTELISVGPDIEIGGAIDELRKRAREAETLDTVYVVDNRERLLGFLRLRDLLLAEPAEKVRDVMHENVISVPPELDQEEVAKVLAKYDLHAMPVVSGRGELLGLITSDDILDVMNEEQAEDVHKMGAVAPIRETYFDATFFEYIKKRAPWLAILFVGGFFTTTAMRGFNRVLSDVAQLSFYVPLLIAAGGNSGSQSSTLVIRGLAVGEIETKDWLRVLGRELMQGLVLGAMLASFGVLRVLIAGDPVGMVGLVAVTLIANVVMGCVVGGMMPLFLHRIGVDPATSSTPFIATLVDVFGILIYLSLAQLMLLGAAQITAP